ncbi:hypothetical protein BCR33DRAFT_722272 [Rhizoclosmatium globosum]|uniref:Uncharacterized protein n=1 Tax=Rhizoclosmatium globosum TaxID=329046 RepID=A0A1Y2BN38_9FUNG|nr:hypothetical protein BCR33DRAFT_722272 [Rhizoclosmatium globosum]|eukprot:ORY36171.1 hypothetical protein BCR33DRAFT_722272 [Rhizoclosmatium globosum]
MLRKLRGMVRRRVSLTQVLVGIKTFVLRLITVVSFFAACNLLYVLATDQGFNIKAYVHGYDSLGYLKRASAFSTPHCVFEHTKFVSGEALFGDRITDTSQCNQNAKNALYDPYTEYASNPSSRNQSDCDYSKDPLACPIEWIVYSTICSKNLNRMADIITNTPGVKLTILGLHHGWRGWGKRLRAYHDYLTRVSPNAMVIISDGDDVLLAPGCDGKVLGDMFLRREGSLQSRILIGSERVLYPEHWFTYKFNKTTVVVRPEGVRDPRFVGRMDPITKQPRKRTVNEFLNAGLVFGQNKHIKHLIKTAYDDDCVDDQYAFQKLYLSKHMAWNPEPEVAASFVSKIDAEMVKVSAAEKEYGHESSEHRAAVESAAAIVKERILAESKTENNHMRYENAHKFEDGEVEDETRGGLIPDHARPLIALDFDNDIFMNLWDVAFGAFEIEEGGKRVKVKSTGGRPCVLHQSGLKKYNRVLEELAQLFGYEHDKKGIQWSKEWQKAHPEETSLWEH